MNGNRLFLDTNIVIYFLNGDTTLTDLLNEKSIYLSFITQLELLSYHKLSEDEKQTIHSFLSQCEIIDINASIKSKVIDIRKKYRLKLPDSIIIASSQYLNLPLVTSDKDFSKIDNIELVHYQKSN